MNEVQRKEFRELFFKVFGVYPDEPDRDRFSGVVDTVLARLHEEAEVAQQGLIKSRNAIADNPKFLQYEKAREGSRAAQTAWKRANELIDEPLRRFWYN